MPAVNDPLPESMRIWSFSAGPTEQAGKLAPRRDVATSALKVVRATSGARECAVVLRGVAVDCVADHAERMADRVIDRAVGHTQQARRGDRCQDAENHHDDHQLDERETTATMFRLAVHDLAVGVLI